MGQNRTSIGLAVALSLALGGAGGYLLGREHAPDPGPAATAAPHCADANATFDDAIEELEALEGSSQPDHEIQAEKDALAARVMTIVDQNPDCYDAGMRATAATWLEDQRQGAAEADTQRIIDCMKDTAPYGC
ncbi:hypothetical protein [Streptomyces diastaticus]|uniref:hypothetical protein n=1 Tax=Streptomyces diastaticus TaxID=1956 RepID=UPI0035D68120